MSCEETQDLLHGYLDGELDLVRTLEIERHLQQCPACADALKSQQALRTALAAAALYHRPPVQLRQRIRSSLRRTGRSRLRLPAFPWRVLGAAAALVLVVLIGWGIVHVLTVSAAEDQLAQQVVASHVRSLMPDHLLDKKSSDQHTVKPWFNGKVDVSPPVKDLARQGFPLLGGRVDYIDRHYVAALVYQRHQHIINLFIWPAAPDAEARMGTLTRQGYHLIHWTRTGLTYWAISDLNEEELRQFVQLIQGKT